MQKGTMYKQRLYRMFYEQPRRNLTHYAERTGCPERTASTYRSTWRKLSSQQKKAEYEKALRDLEKVKAKPQPVKRDPHPMDGFRTPYTVQKGKGSRSLLTWY